MSIRFGIDLGGTKIELIALGGRYHALYDDWVEAVA